ncbi:hypothetical protein QJS04_geneDACA001923 [Acorus gramineus]|uniref:Uncharacterized protein n=1 Tax=Acorus gramineus TaxID=55184 RepID=A0AAV9A845_ACOGR|nr:hypothetical protein QJS04_geneDACA001923 [Acorus gramineus]
MKSSSPLTSASTPITTTRSSHTPPTLPLKKPQTHPIGNPKPPWILHPPIHPFPTTSDPHLLHLKTLSADTIPFSLRLIQLKKRLDHSQSVPTHSPVGRAVSALVSVAAELHRDRGSRETGHSYASLFRHVFSGSPNLLVSLLVLLADYFASSTENSICVAEGGSPPPGEIVSRADRERRRAEYERIIVSGMQRNSLILLNYAQFLHRIAGDLDRAEQYFKLAVQAEPVDAEMMSRYAMFLWEEREDMEGAEEMLLAAIDAEPSSYHTGNYARFLWQTGAWDTCYPLNPP